MHPLGQPWVMVGLSLRYRNINFEQAIKNNIFYIIFNGLINFYASIPQPHSTALAVGPAFPAGTTGNGVEWVNNSWLSNEPELLQK